MGLKLADGSITSCRTCVGPKECPTAEVEWREDQDNIDLMPLSWLIERGCTQGWGSTAQLETPDGQQLQLAMWHRMPYLTSEQVATVMAALPPSHVKWCARENQRGPDSPQ